MKQPTRKKVGRHSSHRTHKRHAIEYTLKNNPTDMELLLYGTLSCPEIGGKPTHIVSAKGKHYRYNDLVENSQEDQANLAEEKFELLEKYGDLVDIEDFI